MKIVSIAILFLCGLFWTVLPVYSAIDLDYLKTLADQGDVKSQVKLGELYRGGIEVKQDYKKAFSWYKKAAENGYAKGQRPLGVLYEMGQGTPVDLKKAAYWYQKAAAQGLPRAQVNLGLLYEAGHGVEKNYERAFSLYQKAADKGYSRGINQLGILYEKGLGIQKNITQALLLYKKGAKARYSKSMLNLGRLYENGQDGLEQDLEAAVHWYKKALEVGYAAATIDLNRVKGRMASETDNQEIFTKTIEEQKVPESEQEQTETVLSPLPTAEPAIKAIIKSETKQQESTESQEKPKAVVPQKTTALTKKKVVILKLDQPAIPLPTNDQEEPKIEKNTVEDAQVGQPTAKYFKKQQPNLSPQTTTSKPSRTPNLSSFYFTVMIILGNLILVWLFWSFILKQRGKKVRITASSALISDLETDITGIRKEVEKLRDHFEKKVI